MRRTAVPVTGVNAISPAANDIPIIENIIPLLYALHKKNGKNTNISVATNIRCGKNIKPKDKIINKKGLISNTVNNT